jgi:hypothetical protein
MEKSLKTQIICPAFSSLEKRISAKGFKKKPLTTIKKIYIMHGLIGELFFLIPNYSEYIRLL